MALKEDERPVAKTCGIGGKDEGFIFYKAWSNAGLMLADRGYNINEQPFIISYDEFVSRHGCDNNIDPHSLTIDCTLPDPNYKVRVIFVGDRILSVATFHEVFFVAEKENLSRVIIIFNSHTLTPQEFERIMSTCPVKVEIFHIYELFVNLAREWPSKYRMSSPEEKKKVFLEGTKIVKLPPDNIIIRYFALEKGQLIHVSENRAVTEADERAWAERVKVADKGENEDVYEDEILSDEDEDAELEDINDDPTEDYYGV